MRLSYVGLRWQRPELVDARLEALPSVDEASPNNGGLAVDILRQHGDTGEALEYAYELVRRFPDDAKANEALVRVFFDPSSRPLPEMVVSGVAVGTAVRYEEVDGREDWVIVEDSPNPRFAFNEYPATHPRAKALIGHHVGETVTLTKTSGRDRTALIKEIMPKSVYRLHTIMRDWQLKFPDEPRFQVFHVLKSDPVTGEQKPDLTDLQIIADSRAEQTKYALDLYRGTLISFHVFAHSFGCAPFLAVCLAAELADLPIRSSRGGDEESKQALDTLNTNPTLVLDLTALAMLSLLKLEVLLRLWPGKLVISQSTATELRSMKGKFSNDAASVGHFGKTEKGYYLQEISSEARHAQFNAYSNFLDTVLEVCEVRGCPALANLDPEKREVLIGIFGQHGLESMLLAQNPGHALWTDDLTVADIASSEFAVRRVWLQSVMIWGLANGIIKDEDYLESTAKLIGFDYQAASFNPHVAVKSGSMASWDADKWPFNKMLEQFANQSIPMESVALYAGVLLQHMYKADVLVRTRETTLLKILDRLAARKNGLILVDVFLTLLPKIFGVNVLAAKECQEIGRTWLKVVERRPRFETDGPDGLILDIGKM